MKKKNIAIILCGLVVITSGFYLSFSRQNAKNKRSLSNISAPETITNLFGLSIEALFESIYSVGKNISSLPYEVIKQIIIDYKLVAFIEEQNLDPKIEARILKRLEDQKYVTKLISFLLEIKQSYLDKSEEDLVDFKNFIKNQNLDPLSKGSTHSLFTLKEESADKKKSKNNFLSSKVLITAGMKLYDILFIQNKSIVNNQGHNGIYQRLTEKDQDIVDKAKPIIKNVLQEIKKNTAKGDIKDTLSMILSSDYKLEAATISLIDFARGLITKYYYAFVSKFQRRAELSKWMHTNYQKDPDRLIKYLELSLNKKYAVQIVVDGLQGHLIKNLTMQDSQNSPFIKQIYKDHLNAKNFKPKNIVTVASKHKFALKFLKQRQKSTFDNKKYLAFFKSLYKNYPNSVARQGIASTPTISVRNLPIIETGAGVAGPDSIGIPNFHFYDRKKQRAYYFFGNDALLLNELTKESGMKTMFKRLAKNTTFNCGATYDELAKQSYDPFINLAVGEKIRDFGEKLCFKNLKARSKTEQILRALKTNLLEHLKDGKNIFDHLIGWLPIIGSNQRAYQLISQIAQLEDQGMPQYLLYYNPWPDHFAHFTGPFSDEIISSTGELARLDYWLSQLNKIYKDSGVLKKTLFAMAGDHGLAPIFFTLNPEAVFKQFNKKFNRNIIVKKISSDEGEGAKINHSYKAMNIHPVDVIVASTAGGNYMMDFFAGPTQKERERQVYTSDLLNWRPLDQKTPINIIRVLTTELKETLDYLVVRDGKSNLQESRINIIAYRDNYLYKELLIRKKNKIFYLNGPGDLLNIYDPLLYRNKLTADQNYLKQSKIKKCLVQAKQNDFSTWCSEKQWRALTTLTARPDSVVQLSHIYDLKIAGSINLFPKFGIGYNTKVPGRHAGESFHEKDAFVGFWGTPVKNSNTIGSVDNGILAPTIYEYLTGKKAVKGKKGWGFSSVLKDLIPKK